MACQPDQTHGFAIEVELRLSAFDLPLTKSFLRRIQQLTLGRLQ